MSKFILGDVKNDVQFYKPSEEQDIARCSSDVDREFIHCIDSKDIDEVIFFFEWAEHNNIHITGFSSRLYAHNSSDLVSLLNTIKQGFKLNPSLFTRTLGLRDFVIEYMETR